MSTKKKKPRIRAAEPELTNMEQIKALSLAASERGLSYGQFCNTLIPGEAAEIFRGYKKKAAEIRKRLAAEQKERELSTPRKMRMKELKTEMWWPKAREGRQSEKG